MDFVIDGSLKISTIEGILIRFALLPARERARAHSGRFRLSGAF